jgi:thioredoxin-dependent peroxiredoxin
MLRINDEAAKQIFPSGWKAPRPYLRIVPQPTQESAKKASGT